MIAAVLLAAAPALAQDAPAPDPDEALLLRARAALAPVAQKMEDVRFLRARFVQEQESLLLDEPIVTEGRLLLRADPGTVVLEVDGERPVRIRSDARSHLVHHVAARRAERWIFERNDVATALLACLGADVEGLEKVFRPAAVTELAADPEEQRPRLVIVALRARDERVAAVVTELELLVDPAQALLREVRHVNPDGERVTLRLSKVELDPEDWERPELAFTEDLPEGTDLRTRRVRVPDSADGEGGRPR